MLMKKPSGLSTDNGYGHGKEPHQTRLWINPVTHGSCKRTPGHLSTNLTGLSMLLGEPLAFIHSLSAQGNLQTKGLEVLWA